MGTLPTRGVRMHGEQGKAPTQEGLVLCFCRLDKRYFRCGFAVIAASLGVCAVATIVDVHQDPPYALGCYPGGSNHRPEHVGAVLATGYQHSLASRYHLYLRVSVQ
jgi:hypothetical protein